MSPLSPTQQQDFKKLVELARISEIVQNPHAAHLVMHNNNILGEHTIPGLLVDAQETTTGIDVKIRLKAGTIIKEPVNICFGVLHNMKRQEINMNVVIEKDAKIEIIGHCIFPQEEKLEHIMDANIVLEENASYHYFEKHIHNQTGTTFVKPMSKVHVGKGADFVTEFELIKGRVGTIEIDFNTTGETESSSQLLARISGSHTDKITINETAKLIGERAFAVLQSKVAVKGQAHAIVYNTIHAEAAHARGHVDCTEILREEGKVEAYPNVQVTHPKAHVTHEARLGGVDNKQLETLMARGLSEEDAEELIIQGLLARKKH